MLLDTWSSVLAQSFQRLSIGVVNFVPNVLIAIIIFIAGWVIGSVVGRVIAQLIRSVRLDSVLRSVGVEELARRAGFNLDAGAFLGALVKWFIIIVFLVAAFDVLGLTQINDFLNQVVLLYLPNVLVAVLILLVAGVLADLARSVVSASARAADITSAGFLGTMTHWSIWIFAILAALYQLGVAGPFVQTLFTGIVVAVSLALGLSFGLGGQHAAAKYIERVHDQLSHKHHH